MADVRLGGDWYVETTRLASRTPWLDEVALAYTTFGIVAFVGFVLAGWWLGRGDRIVAMISLLSAPFAAVATYGVIVVVKKLVEQPRPCHIYSHQSLLESCPALNDFSFPSNHSAVAAAIAATLWSVSRGVAIAATAAAVAMAISRVYVGVHYPHDVVAGLLIGTLVGWGTTELFRHYGLPAAGKWGLTSQMEQKETGGNSTLTLQ